MPTGTDVFSATRSLKKAGRTRFVLGRPFRRWCVNRAIDIEFSTWTSKAGVEAGKDRGMAPIAFRVVKHGLYGVPFFVNPNLAHKTGCTKQDVDLMLHLLKHSYASTRSCPLNG